MATSVSGPLRLVTDQPATLVQVMVRAPKPRPHAGGMVVDFTTPATVTDGVVSFPCVPGPAVLMVSHAGVPQITVPLVVPDKADASLEECMQAAGLADNATQSVLEDLARRIVEGVAAAEQSAATATSQAEIATEQAGVATGEADRARSEADRASETVASGVPDATASTKGKVALSGDLAGTADAPTVPKLASKADLVNGFVPTSQLPAVALTKPFVVPDRAAMLSLKAEEGDVAVITSGADKGTYMLGSGAPTSFSSWVRLSTPDAPVSSVNGQTGVVNLTAGNVGAAPATHTHAVGDVTGLQSALDGKAPSSHSHAIADTTGLQSALDGKASKSQIVGRLFSGDGPPPATIIGAVVGDWYIDNLTKNLYKITGV